METMIGQAKNIEPTILKEYLQSIGWHLVEEALNGGLYLLENKRYEGRQLCFPIQKTAPDYLDAVGIVLDNLRSLYGFTIGDIIRDPRSRTEGVLIALDSKINGSIDYTCVRSDGSLFKVLDYELRAPCLESILSWFPEEERQKELHDASFLILFQYLDSTHWCNGHFFRLDLSGFLLQTMYSQWLCKSEHDGKVWSNWNPINQCQFDIDLKMKCHVLGIYPRPELFRRIDWKDIDYDTPY